MTPQDMIEYIGETYTSVADIAHETKVSCTTIYRILNHEGGHSKRVMTKLRKVYDALIDDEMRTFQELTNSWDTPAERNYDV